MTRVRRLGVLVLAVISIAGCAGGAGDNSDDPLQWLEQVDGSRAQAWVTAENAITVDTLGKDPRFAGFLAQAKAVGGAADRIPAPSIIAGSVYNFWQDGAHTRGIWRRTTPADFETPQPNWTTVLDLDALARSEGKNWVWQGADCSPITETHCLVKLSEGGEDAYTTREFELTTNKFVPTGFNLARGKQTVAWADDNTLLVSREWHSGELTSSGYPYVVKQWRRGTPQTAAVELGRGAPTDVGDGPVVLDDGNGHDLAILQREITFFEREFRLVAPGTPRLALPSKSSILALLDNRVLVKLDEDWQTFRAGSLVALGLDEVRADPQHLKPTIVYAPGPQDALGSIATTRDRLVVSSLHNVRGRITTYAPQPDNSWAATPVELPDNATIGISTADSHGSLAYLTVTSFLTPTALWRLDATTGQVAGLKAMEPKFDASREVVDQYSATSSDGTQVPYFVIHPVDMPLDGANPTILNAYGGFAASETPFYSGALGALWLQPRNQGAPPGSGQGAAPTPSPQNVTDARGGVFVLANIRGGGEFGPAWHDAGLTVHRQRVFDDFAAVAHDLIYRKITTPPHLGIQGGSNGGLLMGVEFTQHPELFRAVDMQIPLLDMMRYEQIAAGASWVGEYGSVAKPDERVFLASISPYRQLKSGVAYPTPFIWTTSKDDRVGPQHARKFAAKLGTLGLPYYFYEVTEGGHGAGANIDEKATTTALEYTYFARMLT